jgi:hypothetical protein
MLMTKSYFEEEEEKQRTFELDVFGFTGPPTIKNSCFGC